MNKKILLWVLSLVLLCSFASATLAEDTLAYYKEDTSGQFEDALGIRNGTIDGATFSDGSGKINSAYDFDGDNDRVTISYGATAEFSLAAWFKTAGDVTEQQIITSDTGTDRSFQLRLDRNTGYPQFLIFVGGAPHFLPITTDYADNDWHHIIATYDGETMEMFIDGASVGTQTSPSGSVDVKTTTYIGHSGSATADYFDGLIDEVAIFNQSLGLTEAEFLFNSNAPTEEQQYPYTISTGNFTITANINNFSATMGEELSVGVSSEYVCSPFTCFNYTVPVEYYTNTEIQLGDNRYSFDSEECTTGDLIEIIKDSDLGGNYYYYCNTTLIQSIPSFANRTIGDLYLDNVYTTTTGTIVTDVLSNDTELYNVTLFPDEYYTKKYLNYNVSVDLNYNFPFFEVSAVDNGTQLNITNFDVLVDGNWTYNVTNGLVPIYINQSTVNISVFSDGYLTYSDTSHNTSNNLAAQMYDYSVNISFYDTNTSLPYNNSNITIFYPSGYLEVKTTDVNGTIFFNAFYNNLNEVGNYNFQVNSKTGYITPTNISATINQSNLPYNNTYGVDRAFFNITIRDVQTGQLLTQNATVTIGGVGQYTTNTGNLIIRDSSIAAGSYVITTFIAGYDLNTRNVDYTAQEEERLTISMVNETGENIGDWIATVLDPFYNEFIGADTRLLEYDPVNDVYNEIDSCVSNSNGRCVYSVEIGIKKYIVTASGDIDGLEYLAQSSQSGEVIYFDQDTVDLFLNLQTELYVSPALDLDIWYYNYTLVNSTGGDENANISFLSAQFLDSEGNSHEVCIDYYYIDGMNKKNATTICATGPSGIVKAMGGYILDRSLTWIAEITLVQAGGDKEVVYSFTYQKEDGLEFQLGIYSKFLIILIFIVMLVISLWLKNILIFGVGAIAVQPFVIAMLPSIWDWKIASIIIFLGLILIYLTRKTESLQSV